MPKSNYINGRQESSINQRKKQIKSKGNNFVKLFYFFAVILVGIAIQQYYELDMESLESFKKQLSSSLDKIKNYKR